MMTLPVSLPDKSAIVDHQSNGDASSPLSQQRHLPLHWLEPKESPTASKNSDTAILPSFAELQRKTWQTLYGYGPSQPVDARVTNSNVPRDKSPKGSVDASIQHLVDLINRHSHYCTLSSCSGRMSLFDPNGTDSSSPWKDDAEEAADLMDGSPAPLLPAGKGRGGWVLVSHDLLSPQDLVDAIYPKTRTAAPHEKIPSTGLLLQEQLPWTFKLEPMLLHVAAASLAHGQHLLRLALDLGFRESGLVVTNARVTVAIRSHSLALAVPLWPSSFTESERCNGSSSLQAPPAFLRALVQEGNQRLTVNWNQLDRLYSAIESNLFQIRRHSPAPIRIRSLPSPPPLKLWSATVTTAGSSKHETLEEIWAIGGYGCGPNSTTPRRSSELFKLTRRNGGTFLWNDEWQEVRATLEASPEGRFFNLTLSDSTISGRLAVETLTNTPQMQGMTSCHLKGCNNTLIWGGRSGPTKPSDTLYILDTAGGRLLKVCDVRGGDRPCPRWGHVLVALDDSRRIIMMGGCNNDEGAMQDIFVLHLCAERFNRKPNEDQNRLFFYWEKLGAMLPSPRFHFGASLLPNDIILVFGGLQCTQLLLPTRFDSHCGSATELFAFCVGAFDYANDAELLQTEIRAVVVESYDEQGQPSNNCILGSRFGMSCCTLLNNHLLLTAGGVSVAHNTQESAIIHDPIIIHWVFGRNHPKEPLRIQRIPLVFVRSNEAEPIDFASLVHQNCVSVSDRGVILVGGGVQSFSFGEEYAGSHHLEVDVLEVDEANDGMGRLNEVPPEDSGRSLTKTSHFESSKVIYVQPKEAKEIKSLLLEQGWLDKRLRMNKTYLEDGTMCIAIPITVPHSVVRERLEDAILGEGEQEMPFSTSQFANKGKAK